MYIGEICRYLLNTPVVSEESEHRVRLMIGNGLRPELWDKFVQRFHIERVAELFGSTEGTTNMGTVSRESVPDSGSVLQRMWTITPALAGSCRFILV